MKKTIKITRGQLSKQPTFKGLYFGSFSFFVLLTFITFKVEGQIKVSSDGSVNLATSSSSCPSGYRVYNDGNTYINGYLTLGSGRLILESGGLILGPFSIDANCNYNLLYFVEDSFGDTGIMPGSNNSCTIGSTTNQFYKMYSYQVYQNQALVSSDERKKENIKQIDGSLSKVLMAKGYRYDYKNEKTDSIKSEKRKLGIEKNNKNHLGFLAQELQTVIPEAVVYDEVNDSYYVDYNAVIPILVEAIKEQQATIDDLAGKIEAIDGTFPEKSVSVKSGEKLIFDKAPILAQNIPNPFSDITRIDIFLPSSISKSYLYVYNMQGVQLKSFPINERGNTSVTIEGNTLEAGMYLYTLIADGKEVDTKKMILTK